MLKHSDLFDPLPKEFHDSAFLDRIHSYIPGWEVDIIRGEMFSDGYGFVVDYIAEILRALRNQDFSDRYKQHFTLSPEISTRDRDGINKTFSGLMKIIYPQGEATKDEIEELLRYAIEGRKRVKDQLMRIDPTYATVKFTYTDNAGKIYSVKTLEETEYPAHYYRNSASTTETAEQQATPSQEVVTASINPGKDLVDELTEQHLSFQENQRDVSFDSLFGSYLKDAKEIILTDAYIRLFYQVRNLMELLETLAKVKGKEDEVKFHLITKEDEYKGFQQREYFEKIIETSASVGIQFSWEFDTTGSIHARHIVTDHGWKILLDRGIDIFQQYDMNDAFIFSNRLQQYRQCKAFEVTYIKNKA
jgi:ATP-dependent Lon protease